MSLRSFFHFSSFIALLASPSLHAMVQEDEDASLTKGGKNTLSPSSSSDEMLLPLEIRGYIFSFLTKQDDLLRAGAVSKRWREAAEHMWTTRTLTLPGAVKEQDYATLAGGIFSCVNLQDKKLAAKDIDALLEAFKGTITLKELNLGYNSIGNEGARALAQNTTLIKLHLGSNHVGDEGARALAQNTTLTWLNLWDNTLGDEGARALAQDTTLTSLNLRGNYVRGEGARCLAQNTTLTALNLSINKVGDVGKKALEDLKRRKPSLVLNY
jgi:hypothetical protein